MKINILFLTCIGFTALTNAMESPVRHHSPDHPTPIITFSKDARIFVKIQGTPEIEGGHIDLQSEEDEPLAWMHDAVGAPMLPERVHIHLLHETEHPRHLDFVAPLAYLPYIPYAQSQNDVSECFVLDRFKVYHTVLQTKPTQSGSFFSVATIAIRAPNPLNHNVNTVFWGLLKPWFHETQPLPDWLKRCVASGITLPSMQPLPIGHHTDEE